MKYSKETIDRYLSTMNSLIDYYKSIPREEFLTRYTVKVSYGNTKIGRVLNVSTPAIIACLNCGNCNGCGDGCGDFCYDIKDCYSHGYDGNTFHARAINYVYATLYRDEFFNAINEKMDRKRKNKYFRYQVAGDILDYDYFCRMVDSARRHPDFVVWTYTKCYAFVNRWIRENGELPNNFKVMFSEWDGMALINPHAQPVFACRLADGNKDRTPESFNGMYKCPGNCDICKSAHRGCIAGENTFADEH